MTCRLKYSEMLQNCNQSTVRAAGNANNLDPEEGNMLLRNVDSYLPVEAT